MIRDFVHQYKCKKEILIHKKSILIITVWAVTKIPFLIVIYKYISFYYCTSISNSYNNSYIHRVQACKIEILSD